MTSTPEPVSLGYWLSSEEHSANELVRNAVRAEEVGFETAVVSDHFHPWVRQQGQAPFVWGVLGAIAHATERLEVATGVVAPIIRMHPAVVAHAAATASVLFRGRFVLGMGSGERLNEHVTGQRWPAAGERREMLEEAVAVIRKLLAGGNVNHRGTHYSVENAELFTLPPVPPPIWVAAGGRKGAELAGRVADGLIGVSASAAVVGAFEAAGGTGKRRVGQLHVCWAPTEDEARDVVCRWWPNGGLRGAPLVDLARPKDFEEATAGLSADAVVGSVVCGPNARRHLEAIGRFAAAGFTDVVVHQIGPDQDGFFRFYADEVLPAVVPPRGTGAIPSLR